MRNVLNHWTIKSVVVLGTMVSAAAVASAQASVAAQRGAEIAPFVQTTLLSPDWGQDRNLGYTAGVDYTRYLRSVVQPSLEVRFANASGAEVGEWSFTGGARIGTTVRGIHPYITLLAGNGKITFAHPAPGYPSDTSFVYSIGAGAEFSVRQSWKLRADFVQQTWNLDPLQLTPVALSIGVSYRIPFHGGGWEH